MWLSSKSKQIFKEAWKVASSIMMINSLFLSNEWVLSQWWRININVLDLDNEYCKQQIQGTYCLLGAPIDTWFLCLMMMVTLRHGGGEIILFRPRQRSGHQPISRKHLIYKVIPELLTPFNSEHVTICKNISITRIIWISTYCYCVTLGPRSWARVTCVTCHVWPICSLYPAWGE